MKILFYFCFFLLVTTSFAQVDSLVLPEPDPDFRTDAYELIILDGDTVLRNNVTKELYDKHFRKIRDKNGSILTTNWMSNNWSITEYNPYEEAKIKWPVLIDFSRERYTTPVVGKITSRYGWRRGRPHKGIDIDLHGGDDVRVALDGKVRFARYYGGFGNVIVVRHNNGLETLYAHLSKILVKPNTYVYSGQIIAKGGSTGHSTGSHLHFEVHFKGEAINPEYLFDMETENRINARKLYVSEFWSDPRKHRSYKKSNLQLRTQPLYAQQKVQHAQLINTTPNTAKLSKNSAQPNVKKAETKPVDLVKNQFHTIQRGDTLAKIAGQYATTVENLCKINGISKSSVLQVGQQLRVK